MWSTSGKKLVNLQGLPYMPQIWQTLVQKRMKKGGDFLPTLFPANLLAKYWKY